MSQPYTLCIAMSVMVVGAASAHASTPINPSLEPESAVVANSIHQDAVLIYHPDYFASSNPATARDMIDRLPGFTIRDGDSVRGFAGAGGNVLINGARPTSKADEVSAVLGRTPAGRVERVELIRGAVAGVDMQGHAVVANVVLKHEISRQHTLQAQHYQFQGGPSLPGGRYEYSASDNGKTTGFVVGRLVAMNDSTGSGKILRFDGDNNLLREEQFNSTFEGGGWQMRGNHSRPSGIGKLELTAGGIQYDYQEQAAYRSGTADRDIDTHQQVAGHDIALRLASDLSDTTSLETRLIHETETVDLNSASATADTHQHFVSSRDSAESIARAVMRWRASERWSVESSAEFAYNSMDTDQQFRINGTPVNLPLATTRVAETRGEIAGIATWQMRDGLKMEGGARLERSTIRQGGAGMSRQFTYLKPRLALTWDMSDTQQLRLRAERELGQLDFADFAASSSLTDDQLLGGNMDLRPEQRMVAEAVYEHRIGQRGVVSLTLRHDEITDVIDEMPLPGNLTAIGNIGDGSLDRAIVSVRLPTDAVGIRGGRLTVSAQYDHTRVTDPTTGLRRSISGQRPFRGRVNFEQDVQSLALSWGLTYNPYYRESTYNPDQRRTRELRNYLQMYVEKTFLNGVSARAEYTVWDDYRWTRENLADRQTRELAYIEQQFVNPRDFVQLRVRKTF